MESRAYGQIYTEKGTLIRVHISLSEQSMHLIIFQNENAWKSAITKEELKQLADQHNLNVNSYCEEIMDYIKTASSDVIFNLKEEEFVVNRALSKSLKVKFFTCSLQKTSYAQEAEKIMDSLYFENTQTSERAATLLKEKNELNERINCCELKLNELVNKKLADENEVFGRFVLILNEKKQRIQHLTELLEAFKKGRPTTNPTVEVQNKGKKRKIQESLTIQKKETISDSEASESVESNYQASSDDENESDKASSPQEKQSPVKECDPSTSGASLDFLEDDFAQSPHTLPKRNNPKSSTTDDIVVASSAPSKLKPKPESKEEKKTERKTPEIVLSTQQLLDML